MSHNPHKPAGSPTSTDHTPDTNNTGGAHTEPSLATIANTLLEIDKLQESGCKPGEIIIMRAGKNVGRSTYKG